MNDYEKQREKNIRKNNQLLAQLGLDAVKRAIEPGPVRWRVPTMGSDSTHRNHSVSQEEYGCLGN